MPASIPLTRWSSSRRSLARRSVGGQNAARPGRRWMGRGDGRRAERVLGRRARRPRTHRRHRRGRTGVDGGRAARRRQPARARAARTGRAGPRPGRDPHREPRRAPAGAPRDLPGRLAVRAAEHAPHGRRGRVHPRRLGRRGAGRRRAFADVAGAAAEIAGVPAAARHRRSAPSPASPRWPTRSPADPTTRPTDRVAGQFMQYTSGTTGRPKAVQRDLPRFDPETWVAPLQRQPHPLRHRARWRRGPSRDVADVPPVAALVRLLLPPPRAHRRADGRVGRRTRAAAHRALSRHRRGDGADAVAPADAAAGRCARRVRRLVLAPGHPCRGAVPGGPQAPAVRLAGPGHLRVLRRDRGRRHDRQAEGLARAPGHGRHGRGRGRA